MYSKEKEDAVQRLLEAHGWVTELDSSRAKKHYGDKVMIHPDTGVRLLLDHKSTTNKEGIRITKEQLDKVRKEADAYGKMKDVACIGAITFSLYGSPKLHIIFDLEDLERILY